MAPTLGTVCHCSAWTKGSQYAHRHEPKLSTRHRNWGSTRTPRVEPGASEERGDALVFPKQLLHLLNFIPCTCITYSKKCTFILNASKTPTAYTYCQNRPHHLHAPLWTCPSAMCHTCPSPMCYTCPSAMCHPNTVDDTEGQDGGTGFYPNPVWAQCVYTGEHGCQVGMPVLQGMSSGRVKSGKICAPGMRGRKAEASPAASWIESPSKNEEIT